MFRKRILISWTAGLMGLASAGQSAWAAAPLLVSENFEGGSLRPGSLYAVSGNAPTVTTEKARAGRYAMKSYLNRKTSSNSYRTEISIQKPKTVVGDERWYGFSIFLPSTYRSSPIWEIVAQWHDTPDNWEANRGSPPLHLATSRGGAAGQWTIANIWDAQRIASNGSYKIDGMQVWNLGAYETNKWTDWVFHVKWSYASDGLLQVWKDGKLVVNHTGPNTFNDETGPYFKLGLYKGWKDRSNPTDTVTDRVIYHDEIKVAGEGAIYADVAPGGAATGTAAVPKSPTAVIAE